MHPFRLRLAVAGVFAALSAVSAWVSTPASGSGAHGEVFRAPKVAAQPQKRPTATGELVVVLAPGTDPARFALDYGLAIRYRLRSHVNAYVLDAAAPAAAGRALSVLVRDRRVQAIFPNMRTINERMAFTPNDPYFPKDAPSTGSPGQWHLVNQFVAGRDARVQGAWNRDVTGAGVILGIVDDGVETTHPDLAPNYVAADSFDFGQNDPVPDPVLDSDEHGIAVAGVAAARGGNALGGTGAAPLAGIAGLRVDFVNQTTAMFVDSTLYHSSGANTNTKVKNHSYGIPSPYVPSSAEAAALATSATAGTIHVFAAGNERGALGEDSNKKEPQNSPNSITVAAFGSDGIFANYSCFGANVFVTAPSSTMSGFGITTTDRTTEARGYNGTDTFPDADYTSQFGGTSSAAPLVAGVMALGKQAQPNLNHRFAKHLLVLTSDVVDVADATATSDGGWKANAVGNKFNQNYGFGLIDADGFTAQAPLYSGVTPLATATTGAVTVGAALPDNNAAGVSRNFVITPSAPLEEILVRLQITHPFRGDVEAHLTSPGGTTSRLMTAIVDSDDNLDWTFVSNAFWGENPSGTWTLTVADRASADVGTWDSFTATARMGQILPAGGLAAPSALTATVVSSTKINLAWTDNTTTETGFKVERRTTGSFGQIVTVGADVTTYSNAFLAPNTEYTYRVRAYQGGVNSAYAVSPRVRTLPLPADPSNLTATPVSSTRVNLAWTDNAVGEQGYKIEKKTGPGGSFSQISTAAANATSYTNIFLMPNTEYTYRVRAYRGTDHSGYATSSPVTTPALPGAPTNLTATVVSSTRINLAWTDNATDENGFSIERKVGTAGFFVVNSVVSNVTTYASVFLQPNTQYTYRVRAYRGPDNSAYATSMPATTFALPSAPTNVTATVFSRTRVDVTWTDVATDEAGYKIERKTGTGAFVHIVSVGANVTRFNNSFLSPDTQFTYRVRAYRGPDHSAYGTSNLVTTPP